MKWGVTINFLKVLIGVLGILVVLVLILGYIFFVEGTYVESNQVGIQEITVSEGSIMIKGYSAGSGTGFSKYQYFIENGNFYIKFKYSFVSKANPVGDFNITIYESTDDIKKIYIQGSDKMDHRVIWDRE